MKNSKIHQTKRSPLSIIMFNATTLRAISADDKVAGVDVLGKFEYLDWKSFWRGRVLTLMQHFWFKYNWRVEYVFFFGEGVLISITLYVKSVCAVQCDPITCIMSRFTSRKNLSIYYISYLYLSTISREALNGLHFSSSCSFCNALRYLNFCF